MTLRELVICAVSSITLAWFGSVAAFAASPGETAPPPVETGPAPPAEPPPTDEPVAPAPPARDEDAPTVVTPPAPPETPPWEPAPLRPHVAVGAIPIALSGYFWVDTGYMMRANARAGQYDSEASYVQGRFVLAAEYYQELGSLFALAKTEFIGFVNEFTKSQFEAHVLDAYAQIGQRIWDVQVGRFLAWEVYHRGAGIELYTAEEAGALGGPALYWLDYTRGHKNEAGQLAFHLYPWDFLSFELAGVYGQESNQNNYGLRPVIDFHLGDLQLITGFEYLTQQPQTDADKVEVTSLGFAAKLQYAFPYVTIGANVARGSAEYTDIQGLVDSARTFDKTSVGGFLNVDFAKVSIGLGFHYTLQKNERDEENTHQQLFVSYQQGLPIAGLSLKAVYGFALAHIEDSDVGSSWENDMHSVRLRVAYDFR